VKYPDTGSCLNSQPRWLKR